MSNDSVSCELMPVSCSFFGSVSESDSDSLLGDGGLGGGTFTPTSTSLSKSEKWSPTFENVTKSNLQERK